MVELNHRERTIKVKIVYYGPPVGGKTTNLQVLHQHAQAARRGEMISINSAQDRTILFDLLPLRSAGFRGFELLIQLLAVPGQAMYSATRRLVLKGADAVVFVANSAADRWQENIQSFREMTQNLIAFQLDPASLPLVLQYNKRDLPQVTPMDVMDRALNARKVDALPAVAVRGEGVLETFAAILMRTMRDLSSRYQILDQIKGQSLAQWTQQTVAGMFGTTSLATEPNPVTMDAGATSHTAGPAPAPTPPSKPDAWGAPERRTVRVALPDDAVRMAGAGPDARANETLVDSYVQASAQLSTALGDVREERDTARRRLEDVLQILTAAQDLLSGQPVEATLRGVISRMAEAAGAAHASFLMPEGDRGFRAAALRGLQEEPLLKKAAGVRYVQAKLATDGEARVHVAMDSLDLGDALEGSEPPFGAAVTVPVRTPRGLQGCAVVYLVPDAAIPKAEILGHLSVLSRALSSPLELARTLETVRSAEKTLQLALAGTASIRGLDEIVAFLEELRDRLGTMRKRPDAPFFFLEEFGRLAPSLAGALTTARSLVAFCRGEIQREVVGLREVLSELEISVISLAPGTENVSGDLVLLRLALKALVDQVREESVPPDPVRVQGTSEAGLVKVTVQAPEHASKATPSAASRASGEASLTLVRRIAELHGGTLAVDRSEGSPTRYTLTLVPA
jgi:signal recognition particle receptor subunit beta